MRGKVACADQTIQPDGLTPAWAGKRLSPVTPYNLPSDHPRMGGEKPFLFYGGSSDSGSPPHGRGKGDLDFDALASIGITPAWAGKRCAGTRSQGACRDHPRMGGEKMNKRYEEGRKPGSPPRRRGKGPMLCHRCQVLGITPAWAGKSGRSCGQTSASRDHPRVGGEKAKIQLRTAKRRGSPPHGRGKDVRQVGAVCGRGITPAQAGKR